MDEHKYSRIEAVADEALQKKDDKRTSIVFLSIALALFLACVGFLVWNVVRMRKVDSDYVKVTGKVVDIERLGSSSLGYSKGPSYFLVISYTFDGQEYTFIDREGISDYYEAHDCIGKSAEILVDPQNPDHAERAISSGFISTFCACCFAFFCLMYAAGMNIFLASKGSSFIKRFLFIWGAEILLGVSVMLLFWTGMPHSGFGEVFARNSGAIGVTVVCGLVLLATLVDGAITLKVRPYTSKHHVYRISKRRNRK